MNWDADPSHFTFFGKPLSFSSTSPLNNSLNFYSVNYIAAAWLEIYITKNYLGLKYCPVKQQHDTIPLVNFCQQSRNCSACENSGLFSPLTLSPLFSESSRSPLAEWARVATYTRPGTALYMRFIWPPPPPAEVALQRDKCSECIRKPRDKTEWHTVEKQMRQHTACQATSETAESC